MNGWRWLCGVIVLLPSLSMAAEKLSTDTLTTNKLAADKVTVAVASNFTQAARDIAAAFANATGHQVEFSTSSSGKLFAQISHGAPFDVFLSADVERPALLEAKGLAVPGSRRTYARGRLTLWSVDQRYVGKDCQAELKAGNFDKLAIANPKTAPYGVAAEEVLTTIGLPIEKMQSRIVTGESIAQAFQFTARGGAHLGLIASAQLELPDIPPSTCLWQVPEVLHGAIEQQAVLLSRSADNPAALAFMAFLSGEQARAIIQAHGYAIE